VSVDIKSGIYKEVLIPAKNRGFVLNPIQECRAAYIPIKRLGVRFRWNNTDKLIIADRLNNFIQNNPLVHLKTEEGLSKERPAESLNRSLQDLL
jgi:hypothetical protein